MLSTEDLILVTKNLYLSPLVKDDLELLWTYLSDPRITEYMSFSPHKNIQETEAFLNDYLQKMDEGKLYIWGVRRNNKLIGIFSITQIKRKHYDIVYDSGVLGCWLSPEYWQQGFMLESGRAVLKFAFETLKLNKLQSYHYANNHVAEKLNLSGGLKFSHYEKRAFKQDDQWIDCKHYEMLAEDYFDSIANMNTEHSAQNRKEPLQISETAQELAAKVITKAAEELGS